MAQDRQQFEVHTLENGITVYSHAMEVPFFDISVVIPVGSSSSLPENPGGEYGIAHFLEHVVLNRSVLHPEKDSFTKELSLKGAYVNASTGTYRTRIYGNAPLAIQDELVSGLFSSVWQPILDNEEDLTIERTIVGNERNQRRWFPGSSELQQYLVTKWYDDDSISKQQVFGLDKDLAAMTPTQLTAFHAAYFSDSVYVVVAGGHTLAPILEKLEKIRTQPVTLQKKVIPISWKNKAFHTNTFRDIDTPHYYIGSISEGCDREEAYALQFALSVLCNNVHGPLYKWTREEKGWTYGLNYSRGVEPDRTTWSIHIPLNEEGPVEEIRAEIHQKIANTLADAEIIKTELARWQYNDVYDYQTLDDRLSSALHSIKVSGRVFSEQEYVEMMQRVATPESVARIYQKYFVPEVCGEFLALPLPEAEGA